jgi:hypothetical protein
MDGVDGIDVIEKHNYSDGWLPRCSAELDHGGRAAVQHS